MTTTDVSADKKIQHTCEKTNTKHMEISAFFYGKIKVRSCWSIIN